MEINKNKCGIFKIQHRFSQNTIKGEIKGIKKVTQGLGSQGVALKNMHGQRKESEGSHLCWNRPTMHVLVSSHIQVRYDFCSNSGRQLLALSARQGRVNGQQSGTGWRMSQINTPIGLGKTVGKIQGAANNIFNQ